MRPTAGTWIRYPLSAVIQMRQGNLMKRPMVDLCAWLCLKFDLDQENVIRHYDVTGKNCPKYFVEDEEAWKTFKEKIGARLEEYRRKM